MTEAPIREQLNELLAEAGLVSVDTDLVAKSETYLNLLVRWNARMNLTAVRDTAGILSRHFLESMECARRLPASIETLLDFGSGAGFPGIPIALCRREIAVTLAESQGKKAAFLQEAVRTLGIATVVHSGRAELLEKRFDCVILRAVDKMGEAVRIASGLVRPGGWLALMTTEAELDRMRGNVGFALSEFTTQPLSGSEHRILALVQKPGD